MSDILASVSVVLGAEISGFRAAMADARRELKGLVQFSEGLKDIGSSLTTYVSAPLALLGTAAVVASGKMEALGKGLNAIAQQDVAKAGVTGLEALRQASEQTTARLAVLTEIAKAPGIGLQQAIQGDIRLRAVGVSADQSAAALREFANAIATTGGTAADLDRVTVQLAQLSAKGKVLSQDLRPIIEAAPSVSQALLKMFGTIDSETISSKLQGLGQNSTDFINQLTTELAKAPRVLGGFNNTFENALNSATQAAARFGDAIIKTFNLNAVFDRLSSGLTALGDGFANLPDGVQRTIILLAGAAAAVGPVLVAVGTLGAALPAITAGFATLGVTSLAALTPILPVAAVVAAAAVLIYENWDTLTAYFSSGEGASLFSDLAAAAKSAVAAIGLAFDTIRANVGGNLGDLISASAVFSTAFRVSIQLITAALNVFAGAIQAVAGVLTGDFNQAFEGAKQAAVAFLDPFNLLFAKKNPTDSGVYVLSQQAREFNAAFPALQANVNALNALRLTPDTEGNTAGITKQLGLLEQLKNKLKAVQEQRDKETSTAAITADNAQIKSLQAQIAALEGVDKAGKRASEALTKLLADLGRLSALDNVLAVPAEGINVAARRVAALQAGLKTLVDAGVSPASNAFRALAAETLTLQLGLAKLQASSNLDFKPIEVKSLIPQTIGDTLPDDVARLLGDYAKQAKPFELPVAVKLNMQATLAAPNFQQQIDAALLDVGKGFQLADNSLAVFGNGFDAAGAKANVLGTALQNLLATGISPLSPAVAELGQQYRAMADLSDINNAATAALTSGLTSLATGLLEGLGQLAAGTTTLESFGATMLGLIGKLATQLGEAIIGVGVGLLALKFAFTNPFAAIAAGAALVVIGSALGAISSGLGSVGGGGSASVPSSPRTYAPAQQTAAAPAPITVTHEVIMVQKGGDLYGVLQIATNRRGRMVGGG